MGFKMRSGNGPLQFKQMGASPVKQGLSDFSTKTKNDIDNELEEQASADWWESSPGVDRTDLSKKEIKIRKKTMKKAGTYKGSDLQKQNKAKRKAKRQEIGKGLEEAGYLISDAYGKGGTGSMVVSAEKRKQQKVDNESQKLTDKIKDINIKKYEEGEKLTNAKEPIAAITTSKGETTANTSSVSTEYSDKAKKQAEAMYKNMHKKHPDTYSEDWLNRMLTK